MEFEVVELFDDFFAGFPGEELRVLQDRGVDLLEGKAVGDAAEALKEPSPPPEIVGVEIARSARRLE